jgi:hypothetical protein
VAIPLDTSSIAALTALIPGVGSSLQANQTLILVMLGS